MTVIRAVLFDLDETLHRRQPSVERFARAVHGEFCRTASEAEFVATFLFLDERGHRPREGLFRAIVEQYDLAVEPDTLIERFRATAWRAPVLFDDAAATLRTLRARDYRLGIVTNGSAQSQTAKLHNSGLTGEVDACVISGVVGFKKPDPEIFAMITEELGVATRECVMVGDSIELDISATNGTSPAGSQ